MLIKIEIHLDANAAPEQIAAVIAAWTKYMPPPPPPKADVAAGAANSSICCDVDDLRNVHENTRPITTILGLYQNGTYSKSSTS